MRDEYFTLVYDSANSTWLVIECTWLEHQYKYRESAEAEAERRNKRLYESATEAYVS